MTRRTQRIVISALLSLLLVLVAERFAFTHFQPPEFDPTFQKRINEQKPDLILIGNSTLGNNLLPQLLGSVLTERLGRKINVTFLVRGGTHTAWQYLVMKNQVVGVAREGIPVGLVDYEDYFIRPLASASTGGRSEFHHKIQLKGHDEVFLSKLGSSRYYYSYGFPYTFSQRFSLKRRISSVAAIAFLQALDLPFRNRKYLPEEIIQRLLGRLFTQRHFRAGEAKDHLGSGFDQTLVLNDKAFIETLNTSFIPELLTFLPHHKLFFVLSSSNPKYVSYKTFLHTFAPKFDRYLRERKSFLIDMNVRPEVNDPELMHDSRHFNRGHGQEVNTRALADEIIKSGVLK